MQSPGDEIDHAERRLGRRFPDDYRRYFEAHGPGPMIETTELYVELWPMDAIISLNEMPEATWFFPDLVRFGGDGSREHLAFDYRTEPPRVVLLGVTASTNDDLIEQARSFDEFLSSLKTRGLYFGT